MPDHEPAFLTQPPSHTLLDWQIHWSGHHGFSDHQHDLKPDDHHQVGDDLTGSKTNTVKASDREDRVEVVTQKTNRGRGWRYDSGTTNRVEASNIETQTWVNAEDIEKQ